MNILAIKSLIQSFLRFFGVQLYRLPSQAEIKKQEKMAAQKQLWLKSIGVKTVLDIGANTGQFATSIHQIFPDAMLYSFEPLLNCYEELVTNFKNVSRFQAFNLALGDMSGEVEIYHNNFSPSSSILNMKDLHKESFP